MDLSKILNGIRREGKPTGEGKMPEIEDLSPLGTSQRVEELNELVKLLTLWKLQAVDAYKKKLRG